MTCDEVRPQLPDYSLGTLPDVEKAAIRRHVRGCAACRADARNLDEGVAMFASVAHVADPPPELKDKVMSVLTDEWVDAPAVTKRRPGLFVRWQALAAAAAMLIGVLSFGVVAQANARRFREDAVSYQRFLSALGGKDVRVANLDAAGTLSLEGSAIMYDSDHGQSWILVLARAPGLSTPITVTAESSNGKSITIPFPLKFDPDGEAWTGLVTSADISQFNRIVLKTEDGTLVASGVAQEA